MTPTTAVKNLLAHGLALAGAAAWGVIELLALWRSRWKQGRHRPTS